MAKKHIEGAKELVHKAGVAMGLVDPKAHWIPIQGKEYNPIHPAIRMKQTSKEERSGNRSEHLKNFSINMPSNVVHINTARQNRELKYRRGE